MPTATSSRVYVGNVAWKVSWQDLKDHFREVGEPTFAEIFYDYDGRSKGCGVVEFKTVAEAEEAITKLTDTKLKGRPIFVREDREPKAFTQQKSRGYQDSYYYGKGGYKGYDDYGYDYGKGGYGYDYDWGWKGGKGKGGKGKGYYDGKGYYEGKGYGKGKGKGGFYGGKGGYGQDDYEAKGGYGKGKGKGKGTEGAGKGGQGEGKGGRGGKSGTGDSDKLGKQVYVGNLSWDTTDDELKECFANVGEVVSAQVMSYRSGRSRGNGIVLFNTAKEAEKAVDELNNTQLKGREIFVKLDKYPE